MRGSLCGVPAQGHPCGEMHVAGSYSTTPFLNFLMWHEGCREMMPRPSSWECLYWQCPPVVQEDTCGLCIRPHLLCWLELASSSHSSLAPPGAPSCAVTAEADCGGGGSPWQMLGASGISRVTPPQGLQPGTFHREEGGMCVCSRSGFP